MLLLLDLVSFCFLVSGGLLTLVTFVKTLGAAIDDDYDL